MGEFQRYIRRIKSFYSWARSSRRRYRGTRQTLIRVLEAVLRLAHPLMPFITEEIWQEIKSLAGVSGETIMLAPYPQADESKIDSNAVADIEWLKAVILGVRNIRGEMNISPAKKLPVFFYNGSAEDQRRLEENRQYLIKIAALEDVTWLNPGDEAPVSATALAGDLELLVPMAGLIDKDAELERLGKETARLEKDIEKTEGKLSNANFVDKAPTEVVDKERDRLAGLKSSLGKLQEQVKRIESL